jgi:5-methylcytosine-specific restriction protein A
MFEPGSTYHRQKDIHDVFGGGRQGGISPSRGYPAVFLFASPRGEEYGYRDGWHSDTLYQYTGEGQIGNMQFIRGNRAIRDHQRNHKQLHLFEHRSPGVYEYLGEFTYHSHEIVRGVDRQGRNREVIKFVLELVK